MTFPSFRFLSIFAVILTFMLAGCGPGQENDDGQPAVLGGPEFALEDLGMRGMEWSGRAVLLEQELEFEDVDLELNTIAFILRGDRFDLGQLDDPDLEFRGEPATMSLRMSGLIQDHEPGRIAVKLNRLSARFGDHEGAALGGDSADEVRQALEERGIEIPELDDDNTVLVTFEISASDEDYTEVVLTSDVDFIGGIEMKEGDRAGM